MGLIYEFYLHACSIIKIAGASHTWKGRALALVASFPRSIQDIPAWLYYTYLGSWLWLLYPAILRLKVPENMWVWVTWRLDLTVWYYTECAGGLYALCTIGVLPWFVYVDLTKIDPRGEHASMWEH